MSFDLEFGFHISLRSRETDACARAGYKRNLSVEVVNWVHFTRLLRAQAQACHAP
ncbi:hypothetical protein [Pseudomonas sp. UBA4194]|uniref:hypothetical protein n=1 Tax=Pseudomonas sp. UBA4194 TaxID=1947317 RepID=UPI0025D17967|nr:hypothetical protein [Pseudomonas sp. UBA4194]